MTHFRNYKRQNGARTYHTELAPVGSVELLELMVLNQIHDYEFLPYPFMHTQPVKFAAVEDVVAPAATVRERYAGGDLQRFNQYMVSYAGADICVTFHIQYIPNDTPSVRIVAHRKDEQGFLAEQRPDADLVDVYRLSPYELGAAICQAAPFDEPGQHPTIVVNDYLPPEQNVYDSGDFLINDRVDPRSQITIAAEDVAAYATVQSHWRRRPKWGPDWAKETLVWIKVRDDGDYIFSPDMASAQPMTRSLLHERIDRLIADDVAILREKRSWVK